MGRQTQFHILEYDCAELISFIKAHDPIVVISYDSESPEVREVEKPCEQARHYCLWNQALLQSLEYRYILESNRGSYYRVDSRLPIIEFTPSVPVEWSGRDGLLQGRLYGSFECGEDYKKRFASWYNALGRWIRKNWVKNPVPLLNGYVGPAALDAYRRGLILLPMFKPPLTPQWRSWSVAQDGLRNL
jgi:hypothetical protein